MGKEGSMSKDMKEERSDRLPSKVIRRDKAQAAVVQGRTVDEMADYIRREGGILSPEVMRRAVLGGLEVTKDKYGRAENVVIMGCFCHGVLLTVRSFCLLLNQLGVDYVFLRKEYCCGAPILTDMFSAGEDSERGEELAKEFLGMNISQAREQGAKNVVYFCIWCALLAKRFFSGGDINQLFFADFLVDRLKETQLRLEGRVGYYRGCLRGASIYLPDESSRKKSGLNWSGYRDLLSRIQCLEIVDIPDHYCCKVANETIFKRAEKEGLDTIVCACNDCYGRLQRTAPAGIEIKFLSDILLEAVGGHSR